MTAPSNANTSGLSEKPAHMSDELFEVWRRIKPGPDYAPYRIEAAEKAARDANDRATAAEARADRLAKALETLEAERKREGVNLAHLKRAVAVAYADMNRAALQQETQP